MTDSSEQRGRACAQFINETLKDIINLSGFSGPQHNPWQEPLDTWELILHSRGIKSQIRLFTEPGRFKEAQSPFESIAPASPLLECLYRVFADPANELDEFHNKIPDWEKQAKWLGKDFSALISTLARDTPKEKSVSELLTQTAQQAQDSYTQKLGELMYMRGVLMQNGVVYTLACHWIHRYNQDQSKALAQKADLEKRKIDAWGAINEFLKAEGEHVDRNRQERLAERLKETTGQDGQPEPTGYFNLTFHRLLVAGLTDNPSDPFWIFDSSIEDELTYCPDHFAPIYGATARMLEPGKRPVWLTFEILWKFQWKLLGALREWYQKAPNPIIRTAIKQIELARQGYESQRSDTATSGQPDGEPATGIDDEMAPEDTQKSMSNIYECSSNQLEDDPNIYTWPKIAEAIHESEKTARRRAKAGELKIQRTSLKRVYSRQSWIDEYNKKNPR